MVGSGMLVVNPPWGFEQRFAAMMDELQGENGLGWSSSVTLAGSRIIWLE